VLDAKAIIDVLANPNHVKNIVFPILDDCRQLISSLTQVRFRHYYCETNCCADKLAKMGSSHNLDFAILTIHMWIYFLFMRMTLMGVLKQVLP